MISYITQVTICWGLFYALYAFWLSKETFFNTNRSYLLFTLLAGLVIPLIEFQIPFTSNEAMSLTPSNYLETITVTAQALETNLEEIVITPVNNNWSIQFILLSIYWLGVLFFASRFSYGIFKILRLAYQGKIVRKHNYYLVETDKVHLPFSFLDYMFWSNKIEFNKEDHEKILRHELCHIKEKHSIDVMVTELLCIFLWCSPFVFLYKKALKNIHEYLADEAVLKDTPTTKYGQLLLKQSQSGLQIAQANNFIHSQLKKRIIMMTKTKSQRYSLLKYTAIFPLALLLVFAISAKDAMAKTDLDQSPAFSSTQDTIPNKPTSVEEIFHLVEEMPRFYGCEEITDKSERKACADKNMLMYVYKNIKYPATARNSNIQGTVVVNFIIEKDGSVSTPKIIRSIGGGCDEEVLRIVNEMPDFIPGKQRGKAVRVNYNLPVKFKLEGNAKKESADIVTKDLPNDPLVIINGKEGGSYDTINPKDIKEINVLKGEAAFKKYGKKGENGVVEITTVKADIHVVGYAQKNVPAPPKPVEENNEFLRVAEQMPIFPGADSKESSNRALLEFIYTNIKYPAEAKNQGIEGTVVVTFIITKEGKVKEPKIIRSIGGGTDEEVLNVVNAMNDLPDRWTPAIQNGKKVNLIFNLPIKFKLDSSNKKVETEKSQEQNRIMEDFIKNNNNKPSTPTGLEVLELFPNPSDGMINLHFTSNIAAPTTVNIVDSSGKQIYTQTFNEKEVKITDLELKNAANGLLIISLEQGGKVITKELVLQKKQ